MTSFRVFSCHFCSWLNAIHLHCWNPFLHSATSPAERQRLPLILSPVFLTVSGALTLGFPSYLQFSQSRMGHLPFFLSLYLMSAMVGQGFLNTSAWRLTEKEKFTVIKMMRQSRDTSGSCRSSGKPHILIWTKSLTLSPVGLMWLSVKMMTIMLTLFMGRRRRGSMWES